MGDLFEDAGVAESCQVEEPDRVDPSGIPQFTGDLCLLGTAHLDLSGDAETIRDIGGDIHTRFQGLSAYYSAPEAEQLFATTRPVRDRADTFASDVESVASALSTYAEEIGPIVDRLNTLRADAEAFVAEIETDDDWQYDGGKVDRNNELLSDISTTVAEFWAAERRCANAITALVGGTQWTVDDGSGGENMYGMSVEDMSQAGETPWGKAVEEKHHAWEVWHHLKGFVWDGIIVDGIWGTITGLGTLLNPTSDNFGAAWQGLAQLATGVALLGGPVGLTILGASQLLPEDNPVRGWIDDSLDTTVTAGQSMVAWDEWDENPARAAGLVTFNVLTTVATLGAGSAVSGTSAAARAAAAAARVGEFIDPMTHIARGAGAAMTALRIGDIAANLGNLNALDAIRLPDGGFQLADGTILPDNLTIDDLPTGAATLRLDDGQIVFPRDPESTLTGPTVLDPETGNLLLPDGTITDLDGNIVQHADDAPTNPADTQAHTPAEVREPELVGAGANNSPGDITSQVGDNVPGGAAPDGPTNQFDNATPGGSAGGEPPATGGAGGGDEFSTGPVPEGTSSLPGGGGGSIGNDGPGTGGLGDEGGDNWDLPAERDPDEIVRDQVDRANNDPDWFERYYRSNGYRRSTALLDENLNPLPQLTRDPTTGQWIPASDAPPVAKPNYLGDDIPGSRHSATPEQLAHLDEAADTRASAIADDKLAEQHLHEAEQAYSDNPTPENRQAMLDAEAAHRPAHHQMGRMSEDFGETVASQAIAEQYPGATRIETNGPANGTAQFDQIYRREDGSYVVVEAKSSETTRLGSRKLPGGQRVSQGTRDYFTDVLQAMRNRAATDPAGATVARELRQALDAGKVDYVLVQGKASDGLYDGYTMKKFDI